MSVFQPQTCSCFFSLRSKRPFWSEVERFCSLEPAAVFFSLRSKRPFLRKRIAKVGLEKNPPHKHHLAIIDCIPEPCKFSGMSFFALKRIQRKLHKTLSRLHNFTLNSVQSHVSSILNTWVFKRTKAGRRGPWVERRASAHPPLTQSSSRSRDMPLTVQAPDLKGHAHDRPTDCPAALRIFQY